MIRYRDAAPADAALVADLHRRAFIETFGHLYRPEDLAAFLRRLGEEGFRGELADGQHQIRLAETEAGAVAFAKLGPLTLPVEPNGPTLELRQLYVLKSRQGTGIADALMAWLLEQARARGTKTLYLSVWSRNDRARRFYARYGFAYVGPCKFMVGSQADEDEIMRLTLEEGA
jgi:diamine N-acetyltransferase